MTDARTFEERKREKKKREEKDEKDEKKEKLKRRVVFLLLRFFWMLKLLPLKK